MSEGNIGCLVHDMNHEWLIIVCLEQTSITQTRGVSQYGLAIYIKKVS
jgi:hypothetical protein